MAYTTRSMNAYIHAIATAVPDTAYTQEYALRFMKEHVANSRASSLALQRLYTHSGIRKRHSVIHEFAPESDSGIFFDRDTRTLHNPGTGERNQRYAREAPALLATVADRVLAQSAFAASDITHIVTASCTGFFAPGLDGLLIRHLGLSDHTPAHHLGFMGCYAALPAMRLARHITADDPQAVVCVVCLELCTIHLSFTDDTNALLSASLFADGAGAALISARAPDPTRPAFQLGTFNTARTSEGEADMTWTIGNHGFDMTLSTAIPDIVRRHMPAVLARYRSQGIRLQDIGYWAVHPGGRAILDVVQQTAGLADGALGPSRDTLHEYGNMSSATLWFVLQAILHQAPSSDTSVLAMAFGPGLTIESGLLEYLPAGDPCAAQQQGNPHAPLAT